MNPKDVVALLLLHQVQDIKLYFSLDGHSGPFWLKVSPFMPPSDPRYAPSEPQVNLKELCPK